MLIAAGIAFCGGLSWWMFSHAGTAGSTPYGTLGVIFAVLGVVLAVYLWNLNRVLGYRNRDER